MNVAVCALAFFLIMPSFAQQQPQIPSTSPPYTTPPRFPEGQQMPPDKKAPPPRRLTSTEVKQQIKDHLASESTLATAKVNTKVERRSVELTGTVNTEAQHDLAVRIAKSYSGDRQVVDKIRVEQ
jgi:hypothetical protein